MFSENLPKICPPSDCIQVSNSVIMRTDSLYSIPHNIKVIEPFNVKIVDVPKPKINNPDDVLIKITSGGICGSDIGIYNGTNSLATYPRVIGHEFGGIVVCSTLEVMGVHRDGGFAEYVVAAASNVHKFHKDIDESYLGLVEPFTIGVEINRRGQIAKGDKVLIMGSGPIGIAAMQVAKMNGASVIMTDLVKECLEKAKSMGADEIVLVTEENLEERLDKFTDGEDIPVIVDTVCIPSSFEQCVQLACPAGRIVVIGLKNQPSAITMADITKKELTIVGSRLNNNCFDEVIAGFEDGSLHPEQLMTRSFNYKDIDEALTLITEHPQDVLKIVLKFDN